MQNRPCALREAPSGADTILWQVQADRVVEIRTRTILRILGTVVVVAALLQLFWIAQSVLTWFLVSLFLALALDPFVSWVERRGRVKRGAAIGVVYLTLALALVGIGALFVPKLVTEVNGFVEATPGYVHDLTQGRGRLGFLERKYQVVEKVREQVKKGGASRILGLSGAAVAVTKGVITVIVATITIIVMTFFMLLEGRVWVERFYGLLSAESQTRWRAVGRDIYRTVGGYVTGNLLISVVAGVSATVVLLLMGVPYAVALGLLVAVLDLIPLAGATVAGLVVVGVAFLHSVPAGIVVAVFVIVYQQIENHFLQPVVYGRTVKLSPLVVLIAVLVGAEIAGILGALGAIPVAGTIQVFLRDLLEQRRKRGEHQTAAPQAAAVE